MILKTSSAVKWRPDLNITTFPYCLSPNAVLAFVDTETSGLDSAVNEILQFSGIKCRVEEEGLKEIDTIDFYIKNERPIDPEASKVNHITEELLREKGVEKGEAVEKIKDFLSDSDVFAAYNLPFDYGFIQELFNDCGEDFSPKHKFDVMAEVIDTISVYQCQSRTLSKVADYLNLTSGNENVHNAFDDIKMTVKVYEHLLEKYKKLSVSAIMEQGTLKPTIKYVRLWESDKSGHMKRLYFYTDYGVFHFDVLDRSFGNDATYPLTEINMNAFVKTVLKRYNASSIEALSHKNFKKMERL